MKANIKKVFFYFAVCLSLPLFLLLTNPENLPLVLYVIPGILLFLICYVSSKLLLKQFKPDIDSRKSTVLSVMLAILPTMLFVLQSIQQLTVRDLLIVAVLWLLLGWYMIKVDISRK